MKQYFILLTLTMGYTYRSFSQIDSSLLKRIPKDTVTKTMNMDAVYNRPFLSYGKMPVSVGGYLEANWQHLGTDGISDGHQFQCRRMTLFVASSISKRIKFLSEVEFEEGGREIALEFASMDMELHPLLNLRGGIILNPIGAFNQNHDGPKWEYVDRPISATQMLPATWSNAGFGIYGKYYSSKWMFGYECYASGGFDNTIIENTLNRTYLPQAKLNPERFEEINSGIPLITAKTAVRYSNIGELGISYMGGVYNKFQDDGLIIDSKRRCDVWALDMNTTLPKIQTNLIAEWAWINVDVPATYIEQFGKKQHGGFLDIVQPMVRKRILGWEKSVFSLACRLEYVDWNVGKFSATGSNKGDELWSIVPAISYRPSPQTVLRLNYRYQKHKDVLDNPPARTAGFSFGLATYF